MGSKAAGRWDKGLALTAVVLLGAQRQAFPQDLWEWTDHHADWLPLPLLLIAGIFSLGPLAARADSRLASRRTALQRQSLIHLGSILSLLEAAIPGFDHRDLGLHIWRIKRGRMWFGSKRLQRIATYRLGGSASCCGS